MLQQPGGGTAAQSRGRQSAPCRQPHTDVSRKGDPFVPVSLKAETTEIHNDTPARFPPPSKRDAENNSIDAAQKRPSKGYFLSFFLGVQRGGGWCLVLVLGSRPRKQTPGTVAVQGWRLQVWAPGLLLHFPARAAPPETAPRPQKSCPTWALAAPLTCQGCCPRSSVKRNHLPGGAAAQATLKCQVGASCHNTACANYAREG